MVHRLNPTSPRLSRTAWSSLSVLWCLCPHLGCLWATTQKFLQREKSEVHGGWDSTEELMNVRGSTCQISTLRKQHQSKLHTFLQRVPKQGWYAVDTPRGEWLDQEHTWELAFSLLLCSIIPMLLFPLIGINSPNKPTGKLSPRRLCLLEALRISKDDQCFLWIILPYIAILCRYK